MNKPFQLISHLFNSVFFFSFVLFLGNYSEFEWPKYRKRTIKSNFFFPFLAFAFELADSVLIFNSYD